MKQQTIDLLNNQMFKDNLINKIKAEYIEKVGMIQRTVLLVVGIRATNGKTNAFDDMFLDIRLSNNNSEILSIYPGTTDPGTDFLKNPMYPRGCAIVKAGFYKNVWAYGFHRNDKAHPALKQVGAIRLILDSNRDEILDIKDTSKLEEHKYFKDGVWTYDYMLGNKLIQREICTATAGINNHRANRWSIAKYVGLNSAGCQVIQKYEDHEEHMTNVLSYIAKGQNLFSFLLLDEANL